MVKNKKVNYKIIIKIIIAILIVVLVFCFLENIIDLIKDHTDIFVIEEGKLSLEETVDAYIIRNETVLKGNNYENGMEKNVSEGKKVAKGDTVFRYYATGNSEIRNKIAELTKQIEEAQKNETTISNNDIDNLKNDIKTLVEETYNVNDIEKIEKNKKQIDEYTSKIAKIVAENSAEGSYLKTLIDERNSYSERLTAGAEEIQATNSGTVSYRIDELEETFAVDNFDYINKEFLNNLNLKTGELIESSEKSGKIINDFNCYLVTVLNSDAAKKAELGNKVRIDIGSDEIVDAEIVYIKDDGDDRIIIFNVNTLTEKLINYRKISANIIWWEYTGLKVPNSAIIHEGDLDYVQRNRAGYNTKILVKVVKSNDSYCLVDNYSIKELQELGYSVDDINDMYNIKVYDKIQVKQE